MGIINRDKSNSERREVIQNEWSALATGATVVLANIPYAASLDAVQLMAFGLSGTPSALLMVNRFIPGTGFTAFALGTTFALVAYGTSGVQSVTVGVSLPQIGSTLTTLAAGDVLMILTGGTNAAVTGLTGGAVIRPLQDIKQQYGLV